MSYSQERGLINAFAYDFAASSLDCLTRILYEVKYEGSLPKTGPYVLLPKHQHWLDIPLEGAFIRHTGRRAYFVMRRLPMNPALEWIGGITVVRSKDLQRYGYTKEEAHASNIAAAEKAVSKLGDGHVVVIHPEKTRASGYVGQISLQKNMILEHIVERTNVLLIPLAVRYIGKGIPECVCAGEPFYARDVVSVGDHLMAEFARLSGLGQEPSRRDS